MTAASPGPELFLLVLGGRDAAAEAIVRAFTAGAADGRARVSEEAIGDGARVEQLAAVVRRVREAAGLVLVTAETLGPAQDMLRGLHDVALRLRSDSDLVGAFAHAVATTLVAGPSDEESRSIVHEMNARLYDLGALIVSPGFGERPLAPWFDNRPGGVRDDGSLSPEATEAAIRHGRRVAWLAGLVARERGGMMQLQL
jgi:hypothetical protein